VFSCPHHPEGALYSFFYIIAGGPCILMYTSSMGALYSPVNTIPWGPCILLSTSFHGGPVFSCPHHPMGVL
jgi:hypothetical protein